MHTGARQVKTKVRACLHVPVGKQVLHERAVGARHAGVVDGEPKGQQVLQRVVQAALRLRLQHLAAGRGLLRVNRQQYSELLLTIETTLDRKQRNILSRHVLSAIAMKPGA